MNDRLRSLAISRSSALRQQDSSTTSDVPLMEIIKSEKLGKLRTKILEEAIAMESKF